MRTLFCFNLLCFFRGGLDVVIRTWPGARHVCRHLASERCRKPRVERADFRTDPPFSLPVPLLWMVHVTSFLCFWPWDQHCLRVIAAPSPPPPLCLLNTILKSLCTAPLSPKTANKEQAMGERQRWASAESDWTLEELNRCALCLLTVPPRWPFCLRGWQQTMGGWALAFCYG